MRRGRRWLAAGAVVAAFCALAGSANAGTPTVSLGSVGTIEYLKSTNTDVLTQDGRTAECDAGDSAIGGGGAISGSTRNSHLNASFPRSFPGWAAEGRTTGVTERTVTAYAVCGEQPTTFNGQVTTLPSAGDPQATQTDSLGDCASGETAIGSGIEVTGANVRIVGTAPPPPGGSGWTSAENVDAVQSTGATFWRGCTSGYDGTTRTAKTKIKPGDAGAAAAACKRSEAVIAGGFESLRGGEPAFSTWATSTRPFDSRDDRRKVPDDGWRATVHNGSGAKTVLRAVAVCAGL
jgi:hypothetical protein